MIGPDPKIKLETLHVVAYRFSMKSFGLPLSAGTPDTNASVARANKHRIATISYAIGEQLKRKNELYIGNIETVYLGHHGVLH